MRPGRVLVVGDLILDRYFFGDIERLSPEAPIPVVRVRDEEERLGGAGNVARNLRELDAEVFLVGAVGPDRAGESLRRLAQESGVDARLFTHAGSTTVKSRVVSGRQHVARFDREADGPLDPTVQAEVTGEALRAVAEAHCLVLSDYGRGVCGDALSRETIDAARAKGKPVIVDPKGPRWEKYSRATVLTPNLRELSEHVGIRLPNEDAAVAQAGAEVVKRLALDNLLVTRSERGMTLVRPEGSHHFPTPSREVADVCGAGDTVVATLAAGLAAGVDLHSAVRLANRAAGIVVERVGTAAVSWSELRADAGKCLSLDALLQRLVLLRRDGRRVVFTNGCFDLLHPGHVRLLSAAREMGDVLVVGVNSDDSVRRLKGVGRPINPLQDRLAVLEAIGCVDYVVAFDEDTPARLIAAIQPDLLVKGGDYRPEEVVGRETTGRTVIVSLEDGFSTSRLATRLGQPP